MSLTVKLYNNTSPAIKIGKSLSEEREVAGVLLQDVEDVAAPMVELSSAVIQPATGKCDWWSCNYAYIPALGRYYFITSKTIVDNDHYVLRLRTDVLYTWRTAITGTSAWISRSKSAGSWYLPDGMVQMDSRVSISKGNPSFTPFFNPAKKLDTTTHCFVLCTAGGNENLPLRPSANQNVHDYLLFNPRFPTRWYALTSDDVFDVMQKINDNSILAAITAGDPKSAVFKLHAVPFSIDLVSGADVDIYAGQYPIGNLKAASIEDVFHTSTMTAYSIPTCDDFRNATGDYQIHLYLPMVGWTTLDPVVAKQRPYLVIKYKTNILTGAGTCLVFMSETSGNAFDDEIVAMYHYNAAISLPITMDTSLEKSRDIMMSAITSTVSIVGSIATENPALIAGAFGGSAVNMGRALIQPVKSSQYGSLSGDSYCVDPYSVAIYYTLRKSPVLDNATAKTNFAACHGLRCEEMKTISSLSGFFKVANYWMDPPAGITEPELNEITSILESGAIV